MDEEASTASSTAPGAVALRVGGDGSHLDVTIAGPLDDASDPTVAAAARLVAQAGCGAPGVELRLVADHPAGALHPLPEAVARRLGLERVRDLLQLRRPLPVPPDHPARAAAPALALRPFRPERDVEPWVRQNDRAFAWHPDQGGRSADQLRAQLEEPWVDLAGFLVLDDPDHPDRLAGSCWTRVHPASGTDPALGEIFVIGVDPDHHGRGLGAALVLAGLDHLAAAGLGTAMLYVEADNAPALRLYDRLGFTVHQRRRIRT